MTLGTAMALNPPRSHARFQRLADDTLESTDAATSVNVFPAQKAGLQSCDGFQHFGIVLRVSYMTVYPQAPKVSIN